MPLVTRLALPVADMATPDLSSSSDQSDLEVLQSESDIPSPIPAGKASRKPARKAHVLSPSSEDEGEVDGAAGPSRHSGANYRLMAARFIDSECQVRGGRYGVSSDEEEDEEFAEEFAESEGIPAPSGLPSGDGGDDEEEQPFAEEGKYRCFQWAHFDSNSHHRAPKEEEE